MTSRFSPPAFVVLAASTTFASLAGAEEFPFGIDVSLTPAAALEMQRSGEGIAASAVWDAPFGPGGRAHADAFGNVPLGDETQARSDAGPLHFNGRLAPKRLALTSGKVHVNLNVFSARKTHEDNILACDLVDGPAAAVAGRMIPVLCSLIVEDRVTQTRP